MPEFERTETVEEANAQRLHVPEYKGWFGFTHILSGYNLAEELGLELHELRQERAAQYDQIGRWEGTLLELRLILFFEARAMRFAGAPGYNPNDNPGYREYIQSLLGAIRQKAVEEGNANS